jgi:hypothetical protein
LVIVILVGGGIVVAGIVLFLKWWKYSQFSCRIWEQDGFGQWRETVDRAGIFVDRKTNNKRFFLKKANVGLSADNVPYISTKGVRKIVYLLRTGLKNFRFIRITPSNPSVFLNVTEEDVNWAVNAYERQKKIFSKDLFLQYLPFMILAFVCIIILVIFIYFFKNFDTLKEVAVAFREAASSIAQANAGTVIVQ